MDTYNLIIAAAGIIVISFFFNYVAKQTKIPSVLMLMLLGVGIQEALRYTGTDTTLDFMQILPVLGNVGLIMIVLEAALDLRITRNRLPLIIRSFSVALLCLIASTFAIAALIHYLVPGDPSWFNSVVYATPLSIMSSAIIIPSVGGLARDKQEFMVYESTFSDILGIMFFYFLVGSGDQESTQDIVISILGNLGVTIVLSIVVAYGLVFLFQQLKSQVKLFLIIAVLMLMYAVGKKFHLSSLIIILAFGLALNNTQLFFRGWLSKYVNEETVKPIMRDFHVLTLETAFVVRTFFFVIFGITIHLASLIDLNTAMISLAIIGVLYAIRLIFLRLIIGSKILPQLFLAPRGLITILLYFAVLSEYQEYAIPGFESGILLYTILISSIIMAIALISDRGEKVTATVVANIKENIQDIRSLPKTVIKDLTDINATEEVLENGENEEEEDGKPSSSKGSDGNSEESNKSSSSE